MTEDGSSAVLLLEELIHEQVHSRTKRIDSEVPDILCKDEERKCCTEGQVSKRGLEILVRLLIARVIEITDVNSHPGQEHNNCQRVEKFAPRVDTKCRNMLIRGIQQFCGDLRTIGQIREISQVGECKPKCGGSG